MYVAVCSKRYTEIIEDWKNIKGWSLIKWSKYVCKIFKEKSKVIAAVSTDPIKGNTLLKMERKGSDILTNDWVKGL